MHSRIDYCIQRPCEIFNQNGLFEAKWKEQRGFAHNGAPKEVRAQLLLESWKAALRTKAEVECITDAIYLTLWKHLSFELQAAIQQLEEYGEKLIELNAVWLWKNILLAHYPGATFGTAAQRQLG